MAHTLSHILPARLKSIRLGERSHHVPAQAKYRHGYKITRGFLPRAVYCPKDVEKLPPDRGVRLEWQPPKLRDEILNRPMSGEPDQVALELEVLVRSNSHRDVEPPVHAPAVGNRVPGESNRVSPHILGVRLGSEKGVSPLGRNEHEEAPVTEVLDARYSNFLPTRSRPFGNVEVVSGDEFGIDGGWVLVRWNFAGDVKKVPVLNQIYGQPLHEGRNGGDFAEISASLFHESVMNGTRSIVSSAQRSKAT